MEINKKQLIYKAIMLVVLTILITMIVTASLMHRNIEQNENIKYVLVSDEQSGVGEDISYLKKIIDKYYLGEVDEEKLKNAALKGYVDGLGDEYSSYISKDEYDDFNANIIGNYVGIGIYMAVYKGTDEIVIISTMKESPAEEAGILAGDIIEKIDGVSYKGTDELESAAKYIKGEEGTKVSLEIKRDEEILNFDIVRRKVIINPITAKVLDEYDIGYIQITSFDENCSKDFLDKYKELQSNGVKSLIIDIRNNGGGIVNEALNIADYIVPKDKSLMVTINKSGEEKITKSKENPIISIPVIVLANENSASASEILIGALKDNNCGKFVGTKTYGKGVIQEILKLKNGSALKLTTEEYFTPNRTKINKVGIEPDENVELPEGVKTSYNIDLKDDTQLNKAIEMLK